MKKYQNLDLLRTLACIGILFLHVMVNGNYQLTDFVGVRIVGTSGNFVFLFFMLSAFGMCCGYYDRIKDGKIDFNKFYITRFKRILPFFAVIVLLCVLSEHSLYAVYQGFIQLTLSFGLLPMNDLHVNGVGWFIGVIFVFYMLFPYFVFFDME